MKKNITAIIVIVLLIVIISSSTYAYLNLKTDVNSVSSTAGCFNIDYTGESGQYISASNLLASSEDYLGGGSSKVTFSKSADCEIYDYMNIYLNTNEDGTSADLLSEGALKYTVVDENDTIIGQGAITATGSLLLKTVPLTTKSSTYTVYTWIDKNITSKSEKVYNELTYSGYIYSDTNQTSTFNGVLVRDISYNANNAQAVGATIDKTNSIITTDGIDDYIDCKLSNHDFKNSITMITRVKLNELPTANRYHLLGNWKEDGTGSGIWIDNNQSFTSELNISGESKTITSPNTNKISPNTWYTVISTYDGTNFKLYINGEEEQNLTLETEQKNITPSTAPFYISSKLNSEGLQDNFVNATYSDILVFDRALTQEEISTTYTNEIDPTQVDKTNLLFYYNFS